MKRTVVVAIAGLLTAGAEAIVGVPGNVQLYGKQQLLEPLVPKFRQCGANKIILRRNGQRSELFIDQDPRVITVFACVRRVARNMRWQVQVNFGKYGQYEI